jgi:mannose-6-phosphate isomerase-like protein (cupin superfamily)
VVTTALDDQGQSFIASDSGGALVLGDAFATSFNIWETGAFPVATSGDFTPHSYLQFEPASGMRVYTTAFAPEGSWGDDADAVVDRAMSTVGLGGTRGDRPAGFHTTMTVDIQTVISGEIYAVMDKGEVLLRQGDSIVMRGVPHTWRNRSGEVAVVLAVMMAADQGWPSQRDTTSDNLTQERGKS